MATRTSQSSELKAIKSDLQDLREDMKSLAHALGDNGSHPKIEELKHRFSEASEEMKQRLRKGFDEKYAQAQEGLEHAATESRKRIQERPLTMVVTAFAAGLIVDHLLTRD
jgi:ElaB/YqjD/DUF883 family membrane-anchored ribosome-binding protein